MFKLFIYLGFQFTKKKMRSSTPPESVDYCLVHSVILVCASSDYTNVHANDCVKYVAVFQTLPLVHIIRNGTFREQIDFVAPSAILTRLGKDYITILLIYY